MKKKAPKGRICTWFLLAREVREINLGQAPPWGLPAGRGGGPMVPSGTLVIGLWTHRRAFEYVLIVSSQSARKTGDAQRSHAQYIIGNSFFNLSYLGSCSALLVLGNFPKYSFESVHKLCTYRFARLFEYSAWIFFSTPAFYFRGD